MTCKSATLVGVTLLCVLGAGGCALVDPDVARDLKFSSIAVVYGKDLAEDSWQGYDSRPNPKLLKIEFTTKYDLFYLPYENRFAIFNRVDFCDTSTFFDKWGPNESDTVYWSGINVNLAHNYRSDPQIRGKYNSSSVRAFYTFLYVSKKWPPDTKVGDDEWPPVSYDLDKEPENICLRVFGADEAHVVFSSNIVFIPKEVIANALAAAR